MAYTDQIATSTTTTEFMSLQNFNEYGLLDATRGKNLNRRASIGRGEKTLLV